MTCTIDPLRQPIAVAHLPHKRGEKEAFMSSLVSPELFTVVTDDEMPAPIRQRLHPLGTMGLRARKLEGLLGGTAILAASAVIAFVTGLSPVSPFAERVVAAENTQLQASLQSPMDADAAHRSYQALPKYQLPLPGAALPRQYVHTPGA